MLYRIETLAEAMTLESALSQEVYKELLAQIATTVVGVGSNRKGCCFDGCSLVLENMEDLSALRQIVNYSLHPCEEAHYIGKDRQYLYALYLMNNDFSIGVFMPAAISPDELINELEEN